MKMKRRHIVPLSQQVKAVLDELRTITGSGKWLFPSALRAMGFTKEQITPHGFRAMFTTIADVIERQLAHVEGNSVRKAYNHAEYLPERVKLMQWWSDYLDSLAEKK